MRLQQWHTRDCTVLVAPKSHGDGWLRPFSLPGILGMEKNHHHHLSSFPLSRTDTWNFGGDPGGNRGPKALCCAGLDGEGVGGPGVQTHKEVVGFIPKLEHFAPLAGEVGARVQWAHGLVVDLYKEPANKHISASPRKLGGVHMEERQGRKAQGVWAWSALLLFTSTLQMIPASQYSMADTLEHCYPIEIKFKPHT